MSILKFCILNYQVEPTQCLLQLQTLAKCRTAHFVTQSFPGGLPQVCSDSCGEEKSPCLCFFTPTWGNLPACRDWDPYYMEEEQQDPLAILLMFPPLCCYILNEQYCKLLITLILLSFALWRTKLQQFSCSLQTFYWACLIFKAGCLFLPMLLQSC